MYVVDARFDIQEGSKCKKSVIFANAQLLTQYGKPVSARDFVFSASVVYAESSGNKEESYAIASAANNHAKYNRRELAQ